MRTAAGWVRTWPFWTIPLSCRLLDGAMIAAALGLALRPTDRPTDQLLGACSALFALMIYDIEAGRRAEGGRLVGQRPHKGLSAWPFAAVLLTANPLAGLIAAPVYGYAWLRGMRVQPWKWVGSAAIVMLSAQAALTVLVVGGAPAGLWALSPSGLRGPALLALAALTFLAVESGLLFGCSITNDPVDERWLKTQLSSRSFYIAELAVLCQAAIVAVLFSVAPALLLFTVPWYGMLQRALLHAPLRDAAERDAKTGLLTHPAWESHAKSELASRRPFSVLLVDLDHFKAVNDRYGHLVGDLVLQRAADALQEGLRPHDLLGRFGGEEFCVLLPDADAETALAVGERLRTGLSALRIPGYELLRVTGSVGVYASDPAPPSRLTEALGLADRALYTAKKDGRDAVRAFREPAPAEDAGPHLLPGQRTSPDGSATERPLPA